LTPTKNDPQQAGSAITYARRYQLAALFNMAQDDDDGNESSGKNEKPQEKKEEPKKQSSEIVILKNAVMDYINMEPAVYDEKWMTYADKQCKENSLAGMKKCQETAIAVLKKRAEK
jgi:hypothetical protein